MASPPTSPSRLSQRRNAVPLLLSAFPVPPSHIPQSPLALTPNSANPATPNSASPAPSNPQNPPPSLPPASPLPPLPGPSPISEHDTLRFITAARSRRASKLSLASSSSHSIRDSTASSVFSLSNYHSRPSSPPESSSRSIRSLSSNGSLSYSHRHAVDKLSLTEPRICEEDPADLTRMSLDEIAPAAVSDAEAEVEDLLEFGLRPSLSKKPTSSRHRGHGLNDSISSIDMRDLPALQEDELENIVPPPPPTRVRQLQSSASTSLSRQISRSKLNKELPPLPGPSQEAGSRRADSPDIGAILASTPKPRRKSSPSLASTSRSVSRTRSSRSGPKRRVSAPLTANGSSISISVESFDGLVASPSELPYIRQPAEDIPDDASFVSDYGVCVDKTGTAIEIFDKETEDRLERELEGAGSDSDSSIDLHTPLPCVPHFLLCDIQTDLCRSNLMLREGMLSPNSKLLSQRSGAPSPVSGRPGSMFSVASSSASPEFVFLPDWTDMPAVMTKSGIYKDERDTVHRRTRHRDGRLLRGGIGLTTGLGWSDRCAPSSFPFWPTSDSVQRRRRRALGAHPPRLLPRPLPQGVLHLPPVPAPPLPLRQRHPRLGLVGLGPRAHHRPIVPTAHVMAPHDPDEHRQQRLRRLPRRALFGAHVGGLGLLLCSAQPPDIRVHRPQRSRDA
ncbi:hypothetical protein K474DRAFT_1064242 [Panus rudis PR-1116 ss-1]|nr:hypothetical protein K474DRAFT_1064242 [Panus rudis PR-1116 ss-1]